MIYPAHDVRRSGYVTFRVDGEWLGIPVVLVQEVLAHQAVSPVPLAPAEVAGFLNLRGQIVTAIDLRTRLGLRPREPGAPHMNVVVRDGGELFSFLVDGVGDVVEAAADRLEPTPATLDARWRECSDGVLRMEDGLLTVLRVERLLRPAAAAA